MRNLSILELQKKYNPNENSPSLAGIESLVTRSLEAVKKRIYIVSYKIIIRYRIKQAIG